MGELDSVIGTRFCFDKRDSTLETGLPKGGLQTLQLSWVGRLLGASMCQATVPLQRAEAEPEAESAGAHMACGVTHGITAS